MRELKLVAVGSSELIAGEIKEIIESFLGQSFPIATQTTNAVKSAEPDVFYICATTQKAALEAVIPPEQLFVFDLHPTTMFFLSIAKIPAGEEVVVFNNLLPYTELLAQECRELGIRHLRFCPVIYDEMREDEIRKRLAAARYIIGVDRMTGDEVLLSETYRPYLREDVKIIAGQRAASVPSENLLLAGIAAFYLTEFQQAEQALQTKCGTGVPFGTEIAALSQKISRIFHILQNASLQTVTSQIAGGTPPAVYDFANRLEASHATMEFIKGQLDALRYLHKKLAQLAPAGNLSLANG